jgi:nuclease S1
MLRVVVFSILMCCVLVRPAFAWAELGHRLVGELAQPLLTPEASREVESLLRDEPDSTLASIAYWADALRSSDPDRFKATASWHYVGVQSEDCRYQAERDCPDGGCVVEAIRAQIRILAEPKQGPPARRDALKFLVHLVGDVHQPLHASNRPDKGGNGFQVSLRTPIPPEAYARDQYRDGTMGTNLHAVWDYYLFASAETSLKTYAEKLPVQPPAPAPALQADPGQWAGESCRLIAELDLYPGTHRMDHGYLDAMRPLAEKRVVIAAQRLAQLLNDLFSSDRQPPRR